MVRYSWERKEVILSDQGGPVERWQAPFFDQATPGSLKSSPGEILALAQASGFQEGRQEGLAAGRKEAQEIVVNMMSLAQEMTQPFRSMDQLVVRELTHMAMLLAERIVRRELTISSDVVSKVVAETMAILSSLEGEIEIFINPKDATLMRDLAPDLLEGISWKLIETSELLPGGCRVKTPKSFVDASVEKQMEKAFSSLFESCENKTDY